MTIRESQSLGDRLDKAALLSNRDNNEQ